MGPMIMIGLGITAGVFGGALHPAGTENHWVLGGFLWMACFLLIIFGIIWAIARWFTWYVDVYEVEKRERAYQAEQWRNFQALKRTLGPDSFDQLREARDRASRGIDRLRGY